MVVIQGMVGSHLRDIGPGIQVGPYAWPPPKATKPWVSYTEMKGLAAVRVLPELVVRLP
jgi:hypothetical protein